MVFVAAVKEKLEVSNTEQEHRLVFPHVILWYRLIRESQCPDCQARDHTRGEWNDTLSPYVVLHICAADVFLQILGCTFCYDHLSQ